MTRVGSQRHKNKKYRYTQDSGDIPTATEDCQRLIHATAKLTCSRLASSANFDTTRQPKESDQRSGPDKLRTLVLSPRCLLLHYSLRNSKSL